MSKVKGKMVCIVMPYDLYDKINASIQYKKRGIGKEIRRRLESTFSPGCTLAVTEEVLKPVVYNRDTSP
jgi:hypothetical protein